jgi:hypothetical protein
MLLGRLQPVEIYRLTTATGIDNWGDPTYTYITTFSGVIQPFSSNEGVRNEQRFSNIQHLITCASGIDVLKDDELYMKNRYERISFIEEWDSDIISHKEIYTTNSQWDRTL